MTDAERVAQAKVIGESTVRGVKRTQYAGPVERQRCAKHPTRWESYRWVWWSEPGVAPDLAIEHGDCESVRGCVTCEGEE